MNSGSFIAVICIGLVLGSGQVWAKLDQGDARLKEDIPEDFWGGKTGITIQKKPQNPVASPNPPTFREPEKKKVVPKKEKVISTRIDFVKKKVELPPTAPLPLPLPQLPLVPVEMLPPEPVPQSLASDLDSEDSARNESSLQMISWKKRLPEDKHSALQITATYPQDLSRVWTANKNAQILMHNAIHSGGLGKVVATVEDNVWSHQGEKILVPKGSQAFGFYRTSLKVGDTRLQLTWYRIITPDGIYIDFGEDGDLADTTGQAGVGGEIDNRFLQKYGNALLFSTLQLATGVSVGNVAPSGAFAAQQFNNSANAITLEVLRGSINITPIMKIPAGTRAFISPRKDIVFKPIKGSKSGFKAHEINESEN